MADRYDPFDEIEELFDRMSRQFEDFGREVESGLPPVGGGEPRVDVAETDDEVRVTADLPGFERDDIEVTVDETTLTISAEREEETASADARYHRRERRRQSVSRRIRLPADVAPDAAEATQANGVLTVRLPKVEPDEDDGHRIEVE